METTVSLEWQSYTSALTIVIKSLGLSKGFPRYILVNMGLEIYNSLWKKIQISNHVNELIEHSFQLVMCKKKKKKMFPLSVSLFPN